MTIKTQDAEKFPMRENTLAKQIHESKKLDLFVVKWS